MTIPKLGDYKEDDSKTVVQGPTIVTTTDYTLPNVEKPEKSPVVPPLKLKEVDVDSPRQERSAGKLCIWNKVDTLLLIFVILGSIATISLYYSLPSRLRPRMYSHGPEDDPKEPEYVATECIIEQVETHHQIECCVNEDDEWCENPSFVSNLQALQQEGALNVNGELPSDAPQLPSNHGHGRPRPGCPGRGGGRHRRETDEESGPIMPCLRVLVRHNIGIYGGAAGGHIGLLHNSFITAENFPLYYGCVQHG